MTTPPQAGERAEALLSCPGCGECRTRVIGGPGTKGGPKYWAGCDICRWRTWGDTEADAIEAWNTRAGRSVPSLEWLSTQLCEARNQWCEHHEDSWLDTDENHPDDWIAKFIRDAMFATTRPAIAALDSEETK